MESFFFLFVSGLRNKCPLTSSFTINCVLLWRFTDEAEDPTRTKYIFVIWSCIGFGQRIIADLTKAFDLVIREGLWKIMAKFGCPAKFIAMVPQFYDGMLARVQNDGEFSDPFPVINWIKQDCVLASTLFSMVFSVMLTDDFQDGIHIRHRFDGKLFNLR